MRRFGLALLAVTIVAAVGAPVIGPYAIDRQFRGFLNAPPTRPHVIDDNGSWHAPFIYPWRLTSQLEQRYEEDRSRLVPLTWFGGGHLVRSSADEAPFFLLGADSYGRDVFSRLLYGARISLGLSFIAAAGATILGALLGGIAGYAGGWLDEMMMRGSEFVLVLPAMYVALALRSAMKLVLPPVEVFTLLAGIFAVVGAPFIAVEITMLVPSFIVAEATLSYVGLGFPDPVASWGTMLHDASNVRAFADFPWLLSPAAAMFLVVLGLNLVMQGGSKSLRYERSL